MVRKRHVAVDSTPTRPEEELPPPLIKQRFAIHLIASTCMAASFWGFTTDPHEVTHYIEPLHSILHHKSLSLSNSTSYSYLSLYLPILHIFSLMGGPKASSYFLIRLISTAMTTISIILFYRNIEKTFNRIFPPILLVLTAFSPVLFISSAEMLPESLAMSSGFFLLSFFLNDSLFKGLVGISVVSAIACPFAFLLTIPFVISKLLSSQRSKMISDLSTLVKITVFAVVIPAILIDYYFYEDIVFPSLNLIREIINNPINPLFHVGNGFLYFGLCFPLAIFSLPTLVLHSKYCPELAKSYKTDCYVVSVTALLGFCGLCWFLPAETRFIFPLFPFFLLSATISMVLLQDILNKMEFKNSLIHILTANFNLVVLILHFILGMLVMVGIYLAFSAPTNGFMSLNGIPYVSALAEQTEVNFCMEDIRFFPSNFLFPQNNWTMYLFGDGKISSVESCHFLAGVESPRILSALKSGDWQVFFNSSMSLLNESAGFWYNYLTPFLTGYTHNFYILSARNFSLVQAL